MIMVTGAAGHLGNVLVRELVARGEAVRCLILPGEDTRSLEGVPVEMVSGNILDLDSLRKAFKGVDTLFHMAALVAITPDKLDLMTRVNVEGTRNVIQIAREKGVKRLVYTSSIHALERAEDGRQITELLKFDADNPAGPYDRTKAAASLLVLQAAREGLDAVIVCPTGVIGPHDYRRSEMGEMILEWMENKPSISTDGGFDFVDVRDVARGHILAAEKGRAGEVYLLSGEHIKVSTMRRLVQQSAGIHTFELHFPLKLARLVAPLAEVYYKLTRTKPRFTRYSIETLISNSNISSEKARQNLGFESRPLTQSIEETVQWWLQNRKKTRSTSRLGIL